MVLGTGRGLEGNDVCMVEFGFLVGRACVRSMGRFSDGNGDVSMAFEDDGC